MPDEMISPPTPAADDATESSATSFGELFAEFERTHSHKPAGDDTKQIEGIVVSLDAEAVYLDIGFKTEGTLLRSTFENNANGVTAGDKFLVSVRGRNPEGYYELSRIRVKQPTDWSALEQAFAQKTAIVGVVTAVVKGGVTVDVGVRAFMPASRSGTRDAAELEKLVGQEIACHIIKLDTTEEDVVVDRRGIVEEQARALAQSRYGELKEGDVVTGEIRSLANYGAFVDIGGIDGLLHISDISWSRVDAPEDVLTVGQQLQLKVLKVDSDSKRISLGLKQLEAEPWDTAADKFKVGERVTGTVTRLADFGAFVELQPGIEGLIHVSEMSWVKKVRKPSDMLKAGETVEAVILSISAGERRISLGLKQTLGDPWSDVPRKFPVGSAVEGAVTRLMKFGAFVQLEEGVEGLVHISEIVADRHLHHPQDAVRVGEVVKAQVVGIDAEKRQIRLSMKQLIPTGLAEYLEEHKEGDTVSGRVVELSAEYAVVELGEGVRANCTVSAKAEPNAKTESKAAVDLSSLTSMLSARWKSGTAAVGGKPEALATGQVRTFRITKSDTESQKIEVELA